MKSFALTVLLVFGLQDRSVPFDWKDRLQVAGGAPRDLQVKVDGVPLYEGPGGKAVVVAVENPRLPGSRFVAVRVDGEERVRLWTRSLEAPLQVPPMRLGLAEKLGLQRETDGERMTLTVLATTGDKVEPAVVYEGPLAKYDLTSPPEAVAVLVDGVPVFRMRRVKPGPARPSSYAVADFAVRLNGFREAAGVAVVEAKATLHRACDLHASYLAKNRVPNAHVEDPSRPGYTEEGARVARVSVIHQFGSKRDLKEAVDSLIAAIYHRQALLHPGLKEIGVGWAWDPEGRGVVVIDVSQLAAVPSEPVVYPPPGAKDVPLEFALGGRESPDPVPDLRAVGGYPVTVQFDTSWKPDTATGRLTLDGKEVPCWLSSPDRPARADRPQPDLVALIPREPLKASSTYAVEITCARRGAEPWTRKWSFTTKAP